jgi:hypothetical protein
MVKLSFLSLSIAVGLLVGCNNCEKLTESVCKEIGAEDCAIWKASGGPENVIPGGRRSNKACGLIGDNEVAYKSLIKSARMVALVEQIKKATDDAKRKELTAKLQALSTSN